MCAWVWVLSCHDDEGGTVMGVYSSKVRGLAALRHAVRRERYAAMSCETSTYNPRWFQFTDRDVSEDGTYYMLVGEKIDRHV